VEKIILNSDEWQNDFPPLVLPASFSKVFAKQLSAEQIAGLNDGKIVYIHGCWCVQSQYLKATTNA